MENEQIRSKPEKKKDKPAKDSEGKPGAEVQKAGEDPAFQARLAKFKEEADFKAELERLEAEAAKEQAKIDEYNNTLDEKEDARTALSLELYEFRQQIMPQTEPMNSKRSEKNEIKEKLEGRRSERQSLREQRRELGFGSVEELEQTIADLDWQMSHTTLTLKEEKDMMARIKKLSGMKDSVRAFETREKAFKMGAEEQQELEGNFTEKTKEIASWQEQKGSKDAQRKQLSALINDLQNIRAQRNLAFEKIRGLREKTRTVRRAAYELKKKSVKKPQIVADLSNVNEMLKEQRKMLAEAGVDVQWGVDDKEAAASGSSGGKGEKKAKAVAATTSTTTAQQNGVYPTAPGASGSEDGVRGSREDVRRRSKQPAPPPEDVFARPSRASEDTYDSEKDSEQKMQEIAKQKAEAEERRRKREATLRDKELRRSELDKNDKERKRAERKGKKPSKKEARVKDEADVGTGTGTDDPDVDSGDAAGGASTADERKEDDSSLAAKKLNAGISIEKRKALAEVENLRAKRQVQAERRKKRGIKVPYINVTLPRLPTWQWVAAIIVVVVSILAAVGFTLFTPRLAAVEDIPTTASAEGDTPMQ
eukprot:CAMPEP_0184659276 /NCGR_PEP_ID=MMETSP0308-20130426/29109_1 /TAXON_ID=38269 /ORGANISM="Gloeochaete witrockiana, Strain SAG 46.84" /LENGTH=592 /DNA_ID=CAMNT_0027098993 /DNA_START=6 /DNA_END=1784 /DNA_ORIENTATION=+